MYPTSSFVPSASFNSSRARLTTVLDGNISLFSMVYVATDSGGNATFTYREGAYNTTLATTLSSHSVCISNCSWNLPIAWTGPTPIVSLGQVAVQGDAVAAVNSQLVAAVSSGGSTQVFYSAAMGSAGSWTSLTGSSPVSGAAPNITFQPCKGLPYSSEVSAARHAYTCLQRGEAGVGNGHRRGGSGTRKVDLVGIGYG